MTRREWIFYGVLVGCLLGFIAFLPMNVDPMLALVLGVVSVLMALIAAFCIDVWLDDLSRRRRHSEDRFITGFEVGRRRPQGRSHP